MTGRHKDAPAAPRAAGAADPVAALRQRARECDYLSVLELSGSPGADEVTRAAERLRRLLAEASEDGQLPAEVLDELSESIDDAEAVLRDPARAAAYRAHPPADGT